MSSLNLREDFLAPTVPDARGALRRDTLAARKHGAGHRLGRLFGGRGGWRSTSSALIVLEIDLSPLRIWEGHRPSSKDHRAS